MKGRLARRHLPQIRRVALTWLHPSVAKNPEREPTFGAEATSTGMSDSPASWTVYDVYASARPSSGDGAARGKPLERRAGPPYVPIRQLWRAHAGQRRCRARPSAARPGDSETQPSARSPSMNACVMTSSRGATSGSSLTSPSWSSMALSSTNKPPTIRRGSSDCSTGRTA